MIKPFILVLESFMEAWKKEDWGTAARATQLIWYHSKRGELITRALKNMEGTEIGNPAEALKQLLIPFIPKLLKFEIKGHKSISNVTKDVKIAVEYESADNIISHKTLIARIICEKAPFLPSPNGKWGVNPVSLFTKR